MSLKYLTFAVAVAAAPAVNAENYSPNFSDRFNTTYMNLNIGTANPDDTSFNFASGTDVNTSYEDGIAVSAEVGKNYGPMYFIDNVKLGLELGYTQNDVDQHSTGGSNLAGSEGDLSATTLLANMYHEYDTNTRIVPYYGVGAGIARLKADGFSTTATGQALNDNDVAFAYQATVGANYMATKNTDIGLRYRYLATAGAELTGSGASARAADFDYENHIISIGLTHRF